MSEQESFKVAVMRLAEKLIEKFQARVQHTKPLIRASLNQGYVAGVTDTLKALDQMRATENARPISSSEPSVG